MVSQNRFRQDLLYRINTVEVRLPALRERDGDIPLLVEHFLAAYCRKYGKPLKKAGPAALRKLEGYEWPGNVRELQHAIERAVIMCDAPILQPDDFFFSAPETGEKDRLPEGFSLEHMERLLINRIVKKHGGNVSKAARELGISRAALYRRMEKHGL
jgi:two-component system, NtrC family, response regulator HydG